MFNAMMQNGIQFYIMKPDVNRLVAFLRNPDNDEEFKKAVLNSMMREREAGAEPNDFQGALARGRMNFQGQNESVFDKFEALPLSEQLELLEKLDNTKLEEAWSKKYKDSINCSNPKGFSQKAHCAGKKKTKENNYDNPSNNDLDIEKVEKAAEELQNIPYHYVSIAGQPFENILAIMRKWIHQEVGFDENGRTNDCIIIYDYLKLMNSASISNSMQEFQVLGFQITQLHNFCVKHDVPCLSFVQLNRDGITKESTDVVSGSDRLIWLCTSFTIFKMKSDEEMADDGEEHGNRKLVPIVARHGAGLDDGDYINMNMFGKFGKLVEGKTRNEAHKSSKIKDDGFEQTTNESADISGV